MKVAFFTPTRRQCGIADYSRYLLDHLRSQVEVEVIAVERVGSPAGYAELGRLMNRADLVHIQYEHGFFLLNDAPAENFDALMQAIHAPKVVTMHCLPLEHPLWQRHLDDPSVAFLVHSRHDLESLRARAARGVVETTPHPAPPQMSCHISPAAFRSGHGLDEKTVLTIFGFTKRHKGYGVALEALGRLPAETVLLIAGGPQDERDRRELSDLLYRAGEQGLASRVLVTGYLAENEIGAALGASDIVLAPFTSMTASGSVATALAWERPVVASALAPHEELRDEFGCLQLFESGNAVDLARQVERVLRDHPLRRSLIASARRFREQCSYAELANRTRALYERGVAGAHHGLRAL